MAQIPHNRFQPVKNHGSDTTFCDKPGGEALSLWSFAKGANSPVTMYLPAQEPSPALLPRRFWYRHPVSCQVPAAAPEAEDIAEESGQSWSLLSLALAKNRVNEEKSRTLHQAQVFPSSISATEIGSTG